MAMMQREMKQKSTYKLGIQHEGLRGVRNRGEAEASKPRRPEGMFLTDLEKGTIHEAPKPLFIRKYDTVHCDI